MTVISLFFCLGPRGDAIVARDFRGEAACNLRDGIADFFAVVSGAPGSRAQHGGKDSPVFAVNGTHFAFIKRAGMYFVCATRHNSSPALLLEFLVRACLLFKDFCGVLSEEAFRVNFLLLYELLDEVVDCGYVQTMEVALLKLTTRADPIAVADQSRRAQSRSTLAPTAANRPVTLARPPPRAGGSVKPGGEIFIDVLERLSAVLTLSPSAPGGALLSACSLEGTVLCKSFLLGSPWMRMALAQDLVIGAQAHAQHRSSSLGRSGGGGGGGGGGGVLLLDDINFHACVQTQELESSRVLSLTPPEGEFALLNYRLCSTELALPVRVGARVEEPSPCRVELLVRVTCEVGAKAAAHGLVLRFPVPATTTTVWPQVQKEELAGLVGRGGAAAAAAAAAASSAAAALEHSVEYSAKDKCVRWCIKRMPGGASATLRTRISLSQPFETNIRKALGPIALEFEVPDYSCSKFRVRSARARRVRPLAPHSLSPSLPPLAPATHSFSRRLPMLATRTTAPAGAATCCPLGTSLSDYRLLLYCICCV